MSALWWYWRGGAGIELLLDNLLVRDRCRKRQAATFVVISEVVRPVRCPFALALGQERANPMPKDKLEDMMPAFVYFPPAQRLCRASAFPPLASIYTSRIAHILTFPHACQPTYTPHSYQNDNPHHKKEQAAGVQATFMQHGHCFVIFCARIQLSKLPFCLRPSHLWCAPAFPSRSHSSHATGKRQANQIERGRGLLRMTEYLFSYIFISTHLPCHPTPPTAWTSKPSSARPSPCSTPTTTPPPKPSSRKCSPTSLPSILPPAR